jgi:hypothetical protein
MAMFSKTLVMNSVGSWLTRPTFQGGAQKEGSTVSGVCVSERRGRAELPGEGGARNQRQRPALFADLESRG